MAGSGSAAQGGGRRSVAECTASSKVLRQLAVFRSFDTSGDGQISLNELEDIMEASGLHISPLALEELVRDIDSDKSGEIDFEEFTNLVTKLIETQKQKARGCSRQYLTPDMVDSYGTLFRNSAGDDGRLDSRELQAMFAQFGVTIAGDKLEMIIKEVDDDQSGFLDEGEFFTLLIKALSLKKRKVGPGHCSISDLQAEGWSLGEIAQLGYECRAFLSIESSVLELMGLFPATELRRAGVQLQDLLGCSWDCARAKEAGVELGELIAAGCTVRQMRGAGFGDIYSARQLRQMGYNAARLRAGGFGLAELRYAGFSLTDLRLAGFSPGSLAALEQLLKRKGGAGGSLREEGPSSS